MYPVEFDYVRASSVAEAGKLLAENPDAKLLAGGHSLIPILKLRLSTASTLIDIGRIAELKGIAVRAGALHIGALTTHAELAASGDVKRNAPGLAEAAGMIGDPAVRNRGTIGGNVAHADPASDLPTMLTALGAKLHVVGPGGARLMESADFFEGMMTTALGDNELLTEVEVPAQGAGSTSAYAKLPHPASRYAVIGAAVRLSVERRRCKGAVVVLGGLTPIPTRAPAVEAALEGQELSDEAIAKASAETAGGLRGDLLGDLYASAEYRKSVAHVYVRRALLSAAGRLS